MSDPGFHLAYGTVNADGSLGGDTQGLVSWKISGEVGRYALRFAEGGFVNPPAVILTPHGEDQREVRLHALGWDKDRDEYDHLAKDLAAATSESARQGAREEMREEFENRKVAVRAEAYDVFPDGLSPAKARASKPRREKTSFHVLAIARSGSLAAENPGRFFTGSIDPEDCELGARTNTSKLTTENDVQIVAGIIDCAQRKLVVAYNGCSLDAGHTAVGSFKVTFGNAFASAPVVLASLDLTGLSARSHIRTVRVDESSTGSAELLLGDGVGDGGGILLSSQGRIHFLAIGQGSHKQTAQFAYGVVERKGPDMHGDEYTASYESKAKYQLRFSPAFAREPVLVGTAEHVTSKHIRQVQIAADSNRKAGAQLEVMGRDENDEEAARNTCRINFIAYAPA